MSAELKIKAAFDPEAVRGDFEILGREIYGKPLVYLDNAASAQKPRQVLDRMHEFASTDYANVHRGVHYLSAVATDAYEKARESVRRFLNAGSENEIVFTKGGTEAINLVASSFVSPRIELGDEIVLSVMEHHSNIVPWHFLRERQGAVLKWVDVADDGSLDIEALDAAIGPKTKLVAITHMSNVLGTVTPLATVEVRPQASGPIVAINFTEGQMVKAGDVLARIDPRPYQAALDQAKATLMRDAASLANARRDLGRYQALAKLNAISAQTVATQAMTVKQDEGAVAADRAGVETAALNLSYTDIKAPVSGRVGLRQVDLGNLVTANQTTAVAVVTQMQPMSVLFSVPEDDIDAVMSAVRAGKAMQVVAYDRNDSTKLATGRLESVDNQIDPSTGTVKLRALFDNQDGALFPNQFVNVRLTVRTLHHQTVVPGAALQQGADGAYVFVVAPDKTVSMRAVTPGPADGANVAIDKGLKPGDTVVVDGADRLSDGAEVTLPNAPGKVIAKPSAAPKGAKPVVLSGRHRGDFRALFHKLTPAERQKLRAMSRTDRFAWLRAHRGELLKRSGAPAVAQ